MRHMTFPSESHYVACSPSSLTQLLHFSLLVSLALCSSQTEKIQIPSDLTDRWGTLFSSIIKHTISVAKFLIIDLNTLTNPSDGMYFLFSEFQLSSYTWEIFPKKTFVTDNEIDEIRVEVL